MDLSVIVGAFLAGVIGIVTVYFAKKLEEKQTRKYISRVLFLEVKTNQSRVEHFVNIKKFSENPTNAPEELKGAFSNLGHIQLPERQFDRTFYCALADKIGLLHLKTREKVVQYYGKLKSMDEIIEYIHTKSSLKGFSEEQIELIKMDQTKMYFEKAEEVFDIGEKLIKTLEEQI